MKQRTDYTFKYNKFLGRHGWLRLTPAYSVKLVHELLQCDTLFEENRDLTILDPFCGTATTGIVAAERGYRCDLYDINPFLVWFGNIKSSNFNPGELDMIRKTVSEELGNMVCPDTAFWIPPMKNIERWWSERTLKYLSAIHRYIKNRWGEISNQGAHNLIWIAFARLCIETSAADFNHISVSFKDETQSVEWKETVDSFLSILNSIINSASIDLVGNVKIFNSDSRILLHKGAYDIVITSPPYPNRISYIRELRPYMYWLGFLETGEEAGNLDWKAIGGTWGSATSKLKSWKASNISDMPQSLLDTCSMIEASDGKNGATMAQYVLKFFDDMFVHLSNLRSHLNDKAKIFYIIGNSSFYGNYVRTEEYMTYFLDRLGYKNIKADVIRKRNSKSGLFEFNIKADWYA